MGLSLKRGGGSIQKGSNDFSLEKKGERKISFGEKGITETKIV